VACKFLSRAVCYRRVRQAARFATCKLRTVLMCKQVDMAAPRTIEITCYVCPLGEFCLHAERTEKELISSSFYAPFLFFSSLHVSFMVCYIPDIILSSKWKGIVCKNSSYPRTWECFSLPYGSSKHDGR